MLSLAFYSNNHKDIEYWVESQENSNDFCFPLVVNGTATLNKSSEKWSIAINVLMCMPSIEITFYKNSQKEF